MSAIEPRLPSNAENERGYTVEELWAAVRRRARIALLAAGAVVLVGVLVVVSLPDEWRAEATVVLEPYRPHAELITSAVTPLLEDRLRVARQQLLAGPLLEKVVLQHDLYPEVRKKSGLRAGVDRLRSHLEIRPDGESAIVVAFRTDKRELAAPVVASIARGFVDANTELRTGQATRVLGIIEGELARVSAGLDAQESKVREFRLAHDGELPEQVESNLREAERATRLLDSTLIHMRDLHRRRALIPSVAHSPELVRLREIQSDLTRQLNHAKAVYADGHPEPQRLARELEGIEKLQLSATSEADAAQRERNSIARELAQAERETKALEENIAQARARAQAASKWAVTLAVLERDRDLLREKYRSLMSRKVESEVALELEVQSAPLATHIISPASVPVVPFAPDRMRLLLVVLAMGAGAGAGLGMLFESRDGSLRTPAQARALGVPVLGVLPSIDGGKV